MTMTPGGSSAAITRRGGAGRLGAAFVIAVGASLVMGRATLAAGPQISVLPLQPVPGQRVSVRGAGFCPEPCSTVTVSVDGAVVAQGLAVGADGSFEVDVALTPVSGTSTVVASQTTAGQELNEATTIVRVVASDQSAPPAASREPPAPSPSPTGGSPDRTPVVLALVLAGVVAAALALRAGGRRAT
jgi:hypothetical protein